MSISYRRTATHLIAVLTAATALVPAAKAVTLINAPNLVVSQMTYTGTASTVAIGQVLPTVTSKGNPIKATANGSYSQVFNNVNADGNFGITAAYTLNYVSVANSVATSTSTFVIPGTFSGSFSSKSEGALNLSPDGKSLTIAGYAATANKIDVSNSNTPNHVDPTNPDQQTYARAVAQVSANGTVQITDVNSFSGDNPRAAILADGNYYMVGNSNNGTGTPTNVTSTTGVQMIAPGSATGEATKIGAFVSGFADKPGKPDNYRGETIFDNTLYVTKGSGSNGVDSIYQVGAAGTLPTDPNAPISILPGFPTDWAKTTTDNFHPFGLWFADADTLYVADDGGGAVTTLSGLQKWSKINGTWQLDYVLQNGLNLGGTYSVTGSVTDSSGTINAQTIGLTNITGEVNADGTVSIFGITAVTGDLADSGANPNKLVGIVDTLSSKSLPNGESFTTLQTASYGSVLRGVAFAATPTPEPSTWMTMVAGFGLLGAALRRRTRVTIAA